MSLRAAIAAEHPGAADGTGSALGSDSWARLERLAAASPLYARLLVREPALCAWLEAPAGLPEPEGKVPLPEAPAGDSGGGRTRGRPSDPLQGPGPDADEAVLGGLRRWRRRMSMRIAHRSVNGLASEAATVADLSALAETCLARCWELALDRWTARFGDPWNEAEGRPARFCVLALGKLGGGELNFSSDIDLVYVFDGDGFCRRGGGASAVSNQEFFTRAAETLTRSLDERTGDGFLFRTDTRLRPEGAAGPLVRSLDATEAYYAEAGQTWERLALVKARPVAGDKALGAELLEDLHPFRYPRRPPPSLLGEVAAMKARSEDALLGEEGLERNLKLGRGGIREIEFVAQSLQLLHAGRYPFLHTHATVPALEGLARYGILPQADAAGLAEAYWFLRSTENRLQMREEEQTHSLPRDEAGLASLAASLGFADAAAFQGSLEARRRLVREIYSALFADRGVDRELEDWWTFLTTDTLPAALRPRLAAWVGQGPDRHPDADLEAVAGALRLFACGERHAAVSRESATQLQPLARSFDRLMPALARPAETLMRLNRFATRYGTRRQFLALCAGNFQLLRLLALLCDRSGALTDLFCAHPEIIEEVMRAEMLRRRKHRPDLDREIAAGYRTPADAAWLRLYVRAEQARHVMRRLLGDLDEAGLETELAGLADAVLGRLFGGGTVLAVALGTFGGAELALGSDLDLLFVARDGDEYPAGEAVRAVAALLQREDSLGPVYALDLRLRPHGEAGPLATSLAALAAYHAGGGARPWERQTLLRARIVAGPADLAAAFEAWRDRLLFRGPPPAGAAADLWAMRARIEQGHGARAAGAAFKTGEGGLLDTEFLVQSLQLLHGNSRPVRSPNTRTALEELARAGLIPADDATVLLENYSRLKGLELAIRLDANRPVSVVTPDPATAAHLACWLGFPDAAAFLADYGRRTSATRTIVLRLGGAEARTALARTGRGG